MVKTLIYKDVTLHTQAVFIASRIEVNGLVPAASGPLIEWTRHSMDCSQMVAAYNARQSGSQVELSHILVSLEFECFLEKMAMTR